MSKEHHFNIEDASKYGIGEAVILYNIRYWLTKNKANRKHLHDGRVWTYNSYEAFAELFPYLTTKQIRTRLDSLEKNGILITGNYNTYKPDRTKWYSINEEAFAVIDTPSDQTGSPIAQTGRRSAQMGAPIPDSKQQIVNTNKKQQLVNKIKNKKHAVSFLSLPVQEQLKNTTVLKQAVNTVDTTTAITAIHSILEQTKGSIELNSITNHYTLEQLKTDDRFIVDTEREQIKLNTL